MVRAYADDIAVVLENLWATAPAIADLFDTYGRISNLRLSGDKCVLVPLWPGNVSDIRTLLVNRVPAWKNFLVAFTGKYLGFWIGPESGEQAWKQPLLKFKSRCDFVSSLGLGLWYTICFYRMFAVSVLSFVAQCAPPPEDLLDLEEAVLRQLVRGPGKTWVSKKILWNMDTLFHLPMSFPSFELLALAAKFRVVICEVPDHTELNALLLHYAEQSHADVPLIWHRWYHDPIPGVLTRAMHHMSAMGLNIESLKNLVLDKSHNGDRPKHAQRLCSKALRELPCNKVYLEVEVRPKLTRWFAQNRISGPEGILARRFSANLSKLNGQVPPSVLASMFRTMWNGWCTARRFQQRSQNGCRLSASCSGEDSIEHYSCCAVTWTFAARRLRLTRMVPELQAFLLLDSARHSVARLTRMSLLVYAVYNVVNRMRASNQRGTATVEDLLWEQVRAAGLRNRACAAVLRDLWSA